MLLIRSYSSDLRIIQLSIHLFIKMGNSYRCCIRWKYWKSIYYIFHWCSTRFIWIPYISFESSYSMSVSERTYCEWTVSYLHSAYLWHQYSKKISISSMLKSIFFNQLRIFLNHFYRWSYHCDDSDQELLNKENLYECIQCRKKVLRSSKFEVTKTSLIVFIHLRQEHANDRSHRRS